MSRKLSVIVPNLTPLHIEAIRKAAVRNDCIVRFMDTTQEDRLFLYESEIIFGHLPEVAKNAVKLQWMCTPFAGVDQFTARDAFANPAAVLTNSSGAYGVTIAEHTVMLLLEILRRDPEYRKILAEKEWKRNLPIRSILGSRITFLGTGDIGKETVKRLKAFSPAAVTGINRSGRNPENLFSSIATTDRIPEIFPETDILVISLPGTKDTFHLVGKEELRYLPDSAVIINVGRGSVIDQAALSSELLSGRLFAGLDVFEKEPIPPEDPLWNLPNLVITPHTAGNMTLPYTVNRIVEMFTEDLDNYCAGRPLAHLVDTGKGY